MRVPFPRLACLVLLAAPGAPAAEPAAQEGPATQAAAEPAAQQAPAIQAAAQAAAQRAAAASLTIPQLVERRDLWPARVALLKPQAFKEGQSLPAGAEVWLLELGVDEVRVDAGAFLFRCPVAQTDVLARAQALLAALSPEQVALTWGTLRTRPELWPLRVTLTCGVEFVDGTGCAPGEEVVLRDASAGELSVVAPGSGELFSIEAQQTDVLARARERLALPAAEREPFFTRALAAALEPPAAGAAPSLAGSELVLVYAGRHGCTRCEAFTPELRAFLARLPGERRAEGGADGPRVTLVRLPKDRTAADARAWHDEADLPGHAIAWQRRIEAGTLDTLPIDELPALFVFDGAGRLLERSRPEGESPTVREVLQRLGERLAAAPPAQPPPPGTAPR
jgi:hypothetical protein